MADSPLGTYVDSAGVVRAITGIAQASPGDVLGSYTDASGVPRPIGGVALLGDVPFSMETAGAWAARNGIMAPARGSLWRFIHFGDSLSQGAGDPRTNQFGARDLSFQVALASNGALLPLKNGGVGGQTSAMLAARVVRDVLKYQPDVVGLTMGTNNLAVNGAVGTLADDLATVLAAVRSIGAYFYVTTVPPRAVGVNDITIVNAMNAIITDFAAANGVTLIDWHALLEDPDNPGSYRANYSFDGTHPVTPVSWMMAQACWSGISGDLLSRKQTRPLQDAANLFFTGITTEGAPAIGTVRDPLFRNYRTFTQNGISGPAPYIIAAQFTSGTAPAIVETVGADAAVIGNAWKITATPTGDGSVTFQSGTSGTNAIDLTRYQGRRVRLTLMMSASGFDVDNTLAALAAASDAPVSAFGLSFSCVDSAGNAIPSLNVADPVDGTASLGIASTISLMTQCLLMKRGAALHGQCYDFGFRPVVVEMCIPAGATALAISLGIRFTAAAVTPVTVGLAEFGLVDVGPAEEARPALTESNVERGFLNVSAAKTISDAEGLAIPIYRCSATAAAFALTLPAATRMRGRTLTIKKIEKSANAVTITAAGADLIDGAATLALTASSQLTRLYSNGAGWDVV